MQRFLIVYDSQRIGAGQDTPIFEVRESLAVIRANRALNGGEQAILQVAVFAQDTPPSKAQWADYSPYGTPVMLNDTTTVIRLIEPGWYRFRFGGTNLVITFQEDETNARTGRSMMVGAT